MSDYLALMMANDPGIMAQIDYLADDTLSNMADEGLDFDGVVDALRAPTDPSQFDDDVLAYVEGLSAERLAAEVFRRDFSAAAEWMAGQYDEAVQRMLPFDPQQVWEWIHEQMPRSPWGGEPDIPARPLWWIENRPAQVELVRELLTDHAEGFASRNPPRARRNYARDEHYKLSNIHRNAGMEWGKASRVAHVVGDAADRDDYAERQRKAHAISGEHDIATRWDYDEALTLAQEERRVAASHYQHQERRRADPTVGSAFSRNPPAKGKRNPAGKSHLTSAEAAALLVYIDRVESMGQDWAQELRGAWMQGGPYYGAEVHGIRNRYPPSKTLRLTRAQIEKSAAAKAKPRKNPAKGGHWTSEKQANGSTVYVISAPPSATGGGRLAVIAPYKPRKNREARGFAAYYEQDTGRKVPKGTEWLVLYKAGGVTAHKTLKAAKKGAEQKTGTTAKPRKNPAKGAAFKVKVRSAPKAKAQLVSLPSSAKAQRVGKYVIHRAVTYRGAKMKLLKGWTISTPKGLAVAKYKTKAAAVKAASK